MDTDDELFSRIVCSFLKTNIFRCLWKGNGCFLWPDLIYHTPQKYDWQPSSFRRWCFTSGLLKCHILQPFFFKTSPCMCSTGYGYTGFRASWKLPSRLGKLSLTFWTTGGYLGLGSYSSSTSLRAKTKICSLVLFSIQAFPEDEQNDYC